MNIKKKDLFTQLTYENLAKAPDIPKYTKGLNIEFYMSADEIEKHEKGDLENLKSFAKKDHKVLRMHAPILTFDYSNPGLLANSLQETYGRIFELSHFLGASIIIGHAEFEYGTAFPVEDQAANAVSVWGRIARDAKSGGFMILLENHLEKDPSLLVRLIEKINMADALRTCFDIGHYNVASSLGTKRCLEKYPVGSVKEIHLADNLGDYDSHLPLGEGNIDFATFFEEAGKRFEDVVYTIEPRNPDELGLSVQFLQKTGVLIA